MTKVTKSTKARTVTAEVIDSATFTKIGVAVREFAGAAHSTAHKLKALALELERNGVTSYHFDAANPSGNENKAKLTLMVADGIRASRETMAGNDAKQLDVIRFQFAAYYADKAATKTMTPEQKAARNGVANSVNMTVGRIVSALKKSEDEAKLAGMTEVERKKAEQAKERDRNKKAHKAQLEAAKKCSVKDLAATLAAALQEDESPDYNHEEAVNIVAELLELLAGKKAKALKKAA